jgi:prepilin-type N-terminal cleavage/methylation domain-containing protein/prepilin-type processing-associated H-X9-DG protein
MLCSKKYAFTLVELLAVIAILALLAAMLMPSLNIAKEKTRIIRCQANVQQIAQAYQSYITDNKGHLPPAAGRDDALYKVLDDRYRKDPNFPYNDTRYVSGFGYKNLIAPYLGLPNSMPSDYGPTTAQWAQYYNWWNVVYDGAQCVYRGSVITGVQYVSSTAVLRCPSGEGRFGWYYPAPTSGFYPQNCAWAMDDRGWAWPQFSASIQQFKHPGMAVLNYESWSCNGDTGEPVAQAMPYNAHFKSVDGNVVGVGRNVTYVDGHAEFLSSQQIDARWAGMVAIDGYGNSGWIDYWRIGSRGDEISGFNPGMRYPLLGQY